MGTTVYEPQSSANYCLVSLRRGMGTTREHCNQNHACHTDNDNLDFQSQSQTADYGTTEQLIAFCRISGSMQRP
jgi:hypothetical protein